MYIIKVKAHFDSAHFLFGYNGKCSNIHGHRWNIEVEIKSNTVKEEGQTRGMVNDFKTIKSFIETITDEFDHCLIVEKNTLKSDTISNLRRDNFRVMEVEFRPTAENFAKYFYEIIKGNNYDVNLVTVFETPNNSATYKE